MSETPPPADAKPEKAGAPKSSKLVPLLLVLNLGASGFATFKLATASAQPHEAAPQHEGNPTSQITGPVVPLDPFVVNLDEPGTARYVKVTLQLELTSKDAEAALEKSKQVVRDMILSHLSGLKLADTLGAAAKDKLRTDLVKKMEEILGPGMVRRMFFQEFMVQ